MRLRRPLRLAILLMVPATGLLAADAVRWGDPVDGLQLGIALASKPDPALRIVLRNAGSTVQELPMGFEDEPDPRYNIAITARRPRERELQVFDMIGAKYQPPEDRGPARNLRLPPGGTHEFTYLLSQLKCVVVEKESNLVNLVDVTLDKLLEQGYVVRASFGFRQRIAVSPDISLRK